MSVKPVRFVTGHRFVPRPENRCQRCGLPGGFVSHQSWWRRFAWRFGLVVPTQSDGSPAPCPDCNGTRVADWTNHAIPCGTCNGTKVAPAHIDGKVCDQPHSTS